MICAMTDPIAHAADRLIEAPAAENQWTISPQPTPQSVLETARLILHSVSYCSLSTCSLAGEPWVSPLFFAFDDELSFYWSSAIASQHSQNLYNNGGKGAIALYPSKGEIGAGQGLYFKGTATELEQSGVEKAIACINRRTGQRAGKSVQRHPEDYLGDSVRRMYRFVPQQAWCTGDRLLHNGVLVDTKVETTVAELAAALAQRN